MNNKKQKTPQEVERIADLKHRLRNARLRAVYASARPNFNGRGFSGRSYRGAELYELAMADIKSLCGVLEILTGKKFKRSDPKQEFRTSFSKLLNAYSAVARKEEGAPSLSSRKKETP